MSPEMVLMLRRTASRGITMLQRTYMQSESGSSKPRSDVYVLEMLAMYQRLIQKTSSATSGTGEGGSMVLPMPLGSGNTDQEETKQQGLSKENNSKNARKEMEGSHSASLPGSPSSIDSGEATATDLSKLHGNKQQQQKSMSRENRNRSHGGSNKQKNAGRTQKCHDAPPTDVASSSSKTNARLQTDLSTSPPSSLLKDREESLSPPVPLRRRSNWVREMSEEYGTGDGLNAVEQEEWGNPNEFMGPSNRDVVSRIDQVFCGITEPNVTTAAEKQLIYSFLLTLEQPQWSTKDRETLLQAFSIARRPMMDKTDIWIAKNLVAL